MWHRDTKWANAVRKVVVILGTDLHAVKMQSLQSAIKQGTPVFLFAFQYALLYSIKKGGFVANVSYLSGCHLKNHKFKRFLCGWKILMVI